MSATLSNAGSGCGTGAGGFQPGNTCAREGGGFALLDRLNQKGGYVGTKEDKAWIESHGLEDVWIQPGNSDSVTLAKIVAKRKGGGAGTKFMEGLTDWADRNGKTLLLTPDTAYGGSSVSRLKEFYRRFDFVPNKGRNADYRFSESMIRRPQSHKANSFANALSLSKPLPFGEAVDYVAAKHLLPTTLSSAELMKLAPAVRERAMFSARTANAWYLQKIKDVVDRTVGPSEAGGKPWTGVDAGSARAQLKRALKSIGYAPEPGKAGGIQDLSSDARLNLIVSTQVDMAHGYGQRLQMMQPDMQAMWPAWELVRQEHRKEPRDWPQRWAEAGGEFFPGVETDYESGRMIALKGDPIWARISAFELPYPPFDFNSGMGLNEVDRDECVALGLIEDDWTPPGDAPEGVDPDDFAPGEASAEQFDPEVLEALVQSLGTGYKVAKGVLQMLNEALANEGDNCGTGAGGFKPGNTCAIGGAAQQVDPKTVKGAARWVHRYAWDRTLKGLPFRVEWDRYLRRFKPSKPVKLYRFERADHDPSKAETANVPLQSWTYNREMVESTVESMNEDPDSPRMVVKEYEFTPEQIYTDFTKFPRELRSAIEKEGGESEMDEVLVWKNYRAFTNEQPRDTAGRFAAVHPQGDPPGEPSGRIKHAVLVIGGKRHRGPSHFQALMAASLAGDEPKLDQIEHEGFETESGHFLDREQAAAYAGRGKWLSSDDINLTAHEGRLYTRDAVQAAGLKALCAT